MVHVPIHCHCSNGSIKTATNSDIASSYKILGHYGNSAASCWVGHCGNWGTSCWVGHLYNHSEITEHKGYTMNRMKLQNIFKELSFSTNQTVLHFLTIITWKHNREGLKIAHFYVGNKKSRGGSKTVKE